MAEEKEKIKYSGVLHNCSHCGDRATGKYCKNCGTASGRNEIDEANIAIMKENLEKGFHYEGLIWNRLKIKGGIKPIEVMAAVLASESGAEKL